MPSCELDHIAIGAATLEEGVRFIRDRLGVTIPPGGKHPLMGTHNHLMRLGASSFLEVIAIDPAAPAPSRPRWFGLDDPAQQARLRDSPRLVSWVLRTDDIERAAGGCAVPLGDVLRVTRGDLSWRLTVPADGNTPDGGTIPHLIQWDGGVRPWETMADLGCSLESLTLRCPDPVEFRGVLQSLGADVFDFIQIEQSTEPALSARIRIGGSVVSV
jgi:hypothetical protein